MFYRYFYTFYYDLATYSTAWKLMVGKIYLRILLYGFFCIVKSGQESDQSMLTGI